ncbi:hypothetical protein NKR23_g6316 [Pleurostoma richardsiae]|uniref:Uncharacterized protein n=1 Tax=Pleurostoma richardsiae TaxID=41990 RepID=A0AA38RDS8_9PEZI|nr:hypothetical protein NKR23_g6316 [Pleurostoma richardsiae]
MTKKHTLSRKSSRLTRLFHDVYQKIKAPKQQKNQQENHIFQIVHHPDRPPRPECGTQIPSEVECLKLIATMQEREQERRQQARAGHDRQDHGNSGRRPRENTIPKVGGVGNQRYAAQLRRMPRLESLRLDADDGDRSTIPPAILYTNGPRVYFEEDVRTARGKLAPEGDRDVKRVKDDPFPSNTQQKPAIPIRNRPVPNKQPSTSNDYVHITDAAASYPQRPARRLDEDERAARLGGAAAFSAIPRECCRLCRKPGAGGLGGLCMMCEAEFLVPKDVFGDTGTRDSGRNKGPPGYDDEAGTASPLTLAAAEEGVIARDGNSDRLLSSLRSQRRATPTKEVGLTKGSRAKVSASTVGASLEVDHGVRHAKSVGGSGGNGRRPRDLRFVEALPLGVQPGLDDLQYSLAAGTKTPTETAASGLQRSDNVKRIQTAREKGTSRVAGWLDSCVDKVSREKSAPPRPTRPPTASAKSGRYYDPIIDIIDSYTVPNGEREVLSPKSQEITSRAPLPQRKQRGKGSRSVGTDDWI